MNFSKTSIFFSTNVREEDRLALAVDLGVRYSRNQEKYLGLPNLVG